MAATRERDSNKKCKKKVPVKKSKAKTGAGFKKTFKNIVSLTKKHIKKLKPKCKKAAIDLAIAAAKELASDSESVVNIPRIIPVPKVGGVLPLIPIFAGLSAAGGLVGGAAGIARAVSAIKSARERLQELRRHNQKMDELCIGRGLRLKQYGNGLGICVTKKKN